MNRRCCWDLAWSALVRLFFVLLTIGGGSGVLIYLLLWVLIPYPEEGTVASATTIRAGADEIAGRARALGDDVRTAVQTGHPQAGLYVGAALILLGVLFLGQNLQIAWLRWLDAGTLWPLLLVAGGNARPGAAADHRPERNHRRRHDHADVTPTGPDAGGGDGRHR